MPGRQHPVRLGNGRRGEGHRSRHRPPLRRHATLCRPDRVAERRGSRARSSKAMPAAYFPVRSAHATSGEFGRPRELRQTALGSWQRNHPPFRPTAMCRCCCSRGSFAIARHGRKSWRISARRPPAQVHETGPDRTLGAMAERVLAAAPPSFAVAGHSMGGRDRARDRATRAAARCGGSRCSIPAGARSRPEARGRRSAPAGTHFSPRPGSRACAPWAASGPGRWCIPRAFPMPPYGCDSRHDRPADAGSIRGADRSARRAAGCGRGLAQHRLVLRSCFAAGRTRGALLAQHEEMAADDAGRRVSTGDRRLRPHGDDGGSLSAVADSDAALAARLGLPTAHEERR